MGTNMRPLSFKAIACSLLLTISTGAKAMPGTTPSDRCSCAADTTESAVSYKYKERVDRSIQRWHKLMPTLFTLQFAGDIGMFSAGFGWNYGKSKQWETHMLFGYLPPRQNYSHYWTFTLRETYNPWRINIGKLWSVTPLSVNMSINSILHGDFWMSEPERYPSGYYGFSSRMRFHIGFGQRFSFNIPESRCYLHSKLSVYYEVSTCDLYIRQKFLNSAIPFSDIIVLGAGVIISL